METALGPSAADLWLVYWVIQIKSVWWTDVERLVLLRKVFQIISVLCCMCAFCVTYRVVQVVILYITVVRCMLRVSAIMNLKRLCSISHLFRQLKTTMSTFSAKAEGSVTFILGRGLRWMDGHTKCVTSTPKTHQVWSRFDKPHEKRRIRPES